MKPDCQNITMVNDFYAKDLALLRIACKHCQHEFVVCVSAGDRDPRPFSKREFPLTYGDPPRDCCQIGASMTSETISVLGMWSHESGKWIARTLENVQEKKPTPTNSPKL
jgi:hypothetical protein